MIEMKMDKNLINHSLRRLVKPLKLGKIAYQFYYAPKGLLEKTWRQGIWNSLIDRAAQREMERAAYQLQSIPGDQSLPILDLHFLTGKRFWYQTCFCAYSMAQHTHHPIRPIIYDDGSLEKKYQQEIKRIFPSTIIFLKEELDDRFESQLPQHKFPYLHERRINYPNIRKITDIHVGSKGWKLVLDSDMLFFRKPELLLNWLKNPEKPCHMIDIETSYGYTENLMTSLAQAAIPERLNVGICGLESESIDWQSLEDWCKIMIQEQGTHYYQEQALVAMLMASKPRTVAPAEDYIVMPSQAESIKPKAILHHYVSDSKPWYFRYGWQHILLEGGS